MRLAPSKKRIRGERTTMPINYDQLMALKNLGQKYAYTDREVMLYAYGIGMGADPMDEKELAFVNEGHLHAAPAEGGADLRLGRGLGRRAPAR